MLGQRAGGSSRRCRCRTARPCLRFSPAAALALRMLTHSLGSSHLTHKQPVLRQHRYGSTCKSTPVTIYRCVNMEGDRTAHAGARMCMYLPRSSKVGSVYLQGVGQSESAGADEGQQSDVDGLQQRIEALEKELAESENTHRLR